MVHFIHKMNIIVGIYHHHYMHHQHHLHHQQQIGIYKEVKLH